MAARRLQVDGHDEVYRVECAGAVAFVALHAVVDGRAFGGIRIREYPGEREALDDALRLARAMSRKLALAGVRGGGGKAVLLPPPPEGRAAAVAALGAFVDTLQGRYCCGPDLGFLPEDDAVLRRQTRHVACAGMSAATAQSVLAALDAACPDARSVVVQGLGAVGRPLATRLRDRGLEVAAADPAAAFPEGVRRVAPEAVFEQPCDVFAPCAAGGVLDARSVPRLRCRVVCGGANDPFASDDDVLALHARGIVAVPDVLASSGAAIVGASATLGEEAQVPARLAAVGPKVADVLRRAEAQRRPPVHVAAELADEIVASWRRA